MDEQTRFALEKSFVGLVDLYGVARVAKMKAMSANQVRKRYLRERDGVSGGQRVRKPKPQRKKATS